MITKSTIDVEVADAGKHDRIVSRIRSQIVSGQLPPGSRLPTRTEYERHFGVARVTVQRAIDRLGREGFVSARRGRAGTYVAEHLPHLNRYGLVFPYRASNGQHWPQFWKVLAEEAARMDGVDGLSIQPYYDILGDDRAADFQELLQDVRTGRLAGLVFAHPPGSLADTDVLRFGDLPRVAIGGHCPGVPTLVLGDGDGFFRRSMTLLRQRGGRRLAIVQTSDKRRQRQEALTKMRALAEEHGLELREAWHQGLQLDVPEWAGNWTRLLLSLPAGERPDALLIADDNFLDPVIGGIIASGVRVPDELRVVAHCNYPCPPVHAIPVARIGYSATEVLETALDLILRWRRKEKVPQEVVIRPRGEDEPFVSRWGVTEEGKNT